MRNAGWKKVSAFVFRRRHVVDTINTGYYAAPILPTLIERREILREAVLL